jgi:hypothetical protein
VLIIRIAQLKPFGPRLHGAAIGEGHAQQVRKRVATHPVSDDSVILDFTGVEGASASYLKRLIHPFFTGPGDPEALPREIAPILINVESTDLKEELDDYLTGKGRVLILANQSRNPPKFRQLLGHLDGAAAETFRELQEMKKSTAAELYERHRDETTNQTAWNNRLVQLVEMRIARRSRVGRFWVYQPTVQS